MPDPHTIEARLTAVEQAVAAMQQQLGPPPAAHWIDLLPKITDDEAFREAMRLGREACNADLPPEAEAGGEAA